MKFGRFLIERFLYGVAVGDGDAAGVDVADKGVAVLVRSPVPGVAVLFGGWAVPLSGTSGHACRFTGKSVHRFTSVQMLSVRAVFSGALQRTTCFPLFTSTVAQVASFVAVDEVFEDARVKVAVSGSTSNAWAMVSTQN